MDFATLLWKASPAFPRRAYRPARLAGAAMMLALLAACGTMREPDTIKDTRSDALEAVMRPIGGSAVGGRATLGPTRLGLGIAVEIFGAMPGTYRFVVHENGICSSPNGFSAGKPWTGTADGKPIVMSVLVGNEGTAVATQTLRGFTYEGLAGRSVVIHAGSATSLEAEPDRRNDRVACGVLGEPNRLLRNIL